MSRHAREFVSASDPILAKVDPITRAAVLGQSPSSQDNGLEYAKRVRLANGKNVCDVSCPSWFQTALLESMRIQQDAIDAHIVTQASKLSK